jgi:hypothetical protein
MIQRQPMNAALGKTFDDNREPGSVQNNVAAVKIAKNRSAHVHWVHCASVFILHPRKTC